jgi:tetratricopeptide (TPR) repeat protein
VRRPGHSPATSQPSTRLASGIEEVEVAGQARPSRHQAAFAGASGQESSNLLRPVEWSLSVERRSGRKTGSPSPGRQVAIYGAAACIVLAPMLVGSGPPWAQMASTLAVLALTLCFAAATRLRFQLVPFAVPAALAAFITLVQLIPLPAPLVSLISPNAMAVQSGAAGIRPSFLPLTMDVPATVIEASKGLACLALLLVVGASARRITRARVLVVTLAFVGSAVAIIHVVQRITGATSIFGLYQVRSLPGAGFFGPFVNGNQAASLLALSALVALGLALDSDGFLRIAAAASAALSAAVLLSTGSRMGAVGLGAGVLTLAGMTLSRRLGVRRALLVTTVLVVLGAGALFTISNIGPQLIGATPQDSARNSQKLDGWRAAVALIGAYPVMGVGRGAFQEPASAYRRNSDGVTLVFPENLLLQIFSEWGIPVALALIVLVVASGRKVASQLVRLEPSAQAAACGVLAVLIHETADFGLELPGVAFPAIVAVAVVVARSEELREPDRSRTRQLGIPWAGSVVALWTVVAVAGVLWAVPHTVSADEESARAAVTARSPAAPTALAAAIRRHPADSYLELLAAMNAMQQGGGSAGRHLGRAQLLYPADGSVHLATARWLASNGRRSQAALEYRWAAERGAIVGEAELLSAVGSNHLADAVVPTPDALFAAAHSLVELGDIPGAREVCQRAVALAPASEEVLRIQLAVATETRSTEFVCLAADQLVAVAATSESFVAAVQALSAVGRHADADGALARGLSVRPDDGGLFLAGLRMRLARGDVDGATAMLRRGNRDAFTMKERIELHRLRAQISEKRGDLAGAAAARAEAYALSHLAGGTSGN